MASKKKVLIAGIGKHGHHRLRFAITTRGYHSIILIPDDQGQKPALAFKEEYKTIGKNVLIIEADCTNYLEILDITLRTLQNKGIKSKTWEFFVGLGTRFITLALAEAARLTGSEMYLVTIRDHEEKTPADLKIISRIPTLKLTKPQKGVLDVLYDADKKDKPKLTTEQLNDRWRTKMGHTSKGQKSAVLKHVYKLEEWGLAIRKKDPKHDKLLTSSITDLGKTIASWRKLKKRNTG